MPWSESVCCRLALHPLCIVGAVKGQQGEAEAVSEDCLDLAVRGFERSREREGI
jgi:hypothetical protein